MASKRMIRKRRPKIDKKMINVKGLKEKEVRSLLLGWLPFKDIQIDMKAQSIPATWNTGFECHWKTIYNGKTDRFYRICCKGPGFVSVEIDGKVLPNEFLNEGNCMDVEGKKIRIHQESGPLKPAKGTYQKLE